MVGFYETNYTCSLLRRVLQLGKLFGYAWHDATSRVVNSRDSETQYPWVVLVMRSYKAVYEKNDKVEELIGDMYCSGTVIGDK